MDNNTVSCRVKATVVPGMILQCFLTAKVAEDAKEAIDFIFEALVYGNAFTINGSWGVQLGGQLEGLMQERFCSGILMRAGCPWAFNSSVSLEVRMIEAVLSWALTT